MSTAILVIHGDPLAEFEALTTEVYAYPGDKWSGAGADALLSAHMPEPGELDDQLAVSARRDAIEANPDAVVLEVEPYELMMAISVSGDLVRPVYDIDYNEKIGLALLCDIEVGDDGIEWFSVRAHPLTDPSKIASPTPVVRADQVVLDPVAIENGRHRVQLGADGVYTVVDVFGRTVRSPSADDWARSAAIVVSGEVPESEVIVVVSVDADRGVRAKCWLFDAVRGMSFGTGSGGVEVTSDEFDQLERVAGANSCWVTAGGAQHRGLLVKARHLPADQSGQVAIDPLSARASDYDGFSLVGIGNEVKLSAPLWEGPKDPARSHRMTVPLQVPRSHAGLF